MAVPNGTVPRTVARCLIAPRCGKISKMRALLCCEILQAHVEQVDHRQRIIRHQCSLKPAGVAHYCPVGIPSDKVVRTSAGYMK